MAEKQSSASKTTPEPTPSPSPTPVKGEEEKLNPTRYGDWEKNGRCIDF